MASQPNPYLVYVYFYFYFYFFWIILLHAIIYPNVKCLSKGAGLGKAGIDWTKGYWLTERG